MNDDSRRLLALSIFHCMNDGSLAVFVSALPVMRMSLELDFVQIGTILALGLVATMLLQLVFGQLTDQGHARWILILGFAGIVAADLILPSGTVFIQVLVFYVLLRSAAGVYHPVSFSSIGRTYAERTAAFGYQGAIGDLGLALGTLSTGILAQTWGWRLPFWVWGAVGTILFAYFCAVVFRRQVGFYSQPIQSSQTDDTGNSRSLKAAFVVLTAASSITATTFILFTGYMPLYFNIIQGFSPANSTAIVAAWIGIGVFAGFMTGRIVRRLGGEPRTLQATFAIEAILFLIANAAVSYGGSAHSWLMIGYAALVLTGIPVFITFPAVSGLLGLRMPHKRLGLTYALNLSLGLMIASLATYLTGYLASLTSAAVIVPALLVVAMLGTAVSLLL